MLASPGHARRGRGLKRSCAASPPRRSGARSNAQPQLECVAAALRREVPAIDLRLCGVQSREGVVAGRAALAKRRRARHHGRAPRTSEADLYLLEDMAVQPRTAAQYRHHLAEFLEWARASKIELVDPAHLDGLMCEFWEHLYFDGHGHSRAEKTLAALEHHIPNCRKGGPVPLARARRALRGFRRLAPGHSRAPLPYPALMAMIGAALATKRRRMALALLLCFAGYLRPGELCSLTAAQLVPPAPGARLRHWALLLAPEELGTMSKTGEFDESASLDWDLFRQIEPALHWLKASAMQGRLWQMDPAEFRKTFHILAELAGTTVLKAHPYSLRHGGASHDAATRHRSIEGVKKQGRWRADSTVARYNKFARVQFEAGKLSKSTLRFASLVERRLVPLLLGKGRPPEPPRLATGRV